MRFPHHVTSLSSRLFDAASADATLPSSVALQNATGQEDVRDLFALFQELTLTSGSQATRSRQIDGEDLLHAAWTRCHDNHAVSKKHSLVD
jgi:hypothetical protein